MLQTNYLYGAASIFTNCHSPIGNITHILLDTTMHYYVRKTPPIHVLRQRNPIHNIPPYFINANFNIIVPPISKPFA
jgi:hypothetical protein